MDSEERLAEVRSQLANGAMTLMDAVDDEALEALGHTIERAERFVGIMRGRGVGRENIAGMLLGGLGRMIYEGADE